VREFSPKELEFLCSVANTIATVLERWRREETQLQLYHRLFELVQDGVMLTDTQGRLLEWNPAMERLTGWTRDEVLGRTPTFLQSGKHPPEFFDRMWRTIRSGSAFVDRVVNCGKDGSEFLAWESVSPVKDPDGTVRYFLAILTDLTERECMLEALRHTEQVKLVGQLAGGILHEIRNPLIGIGSLATHVAEQAALPESVRGRCRLIAEEASRIDAILESHLSQLPKRSFEFRPCDLPALLEDTRALLQSKLEAMRVSVVTDLSPAVPSVEASRGHLQQVWLNVMMNATEVMPQGGQLMVRVHPSTLRGEPGVVIAFEDTGPGIAPEDLAHIHEPFFTSGKAKGVGLGLTISRDIIDRHGGQFTIKSPPGRGAIVEIWLPVRQKE
jgi:PAS domain S-box-containing protein